MTNKIKSFFSIVTFLLIAGFLVWYIKSHWSEFRAIQLESWPAFLGLMILAFVSIYNQGLILKLIVEPFGINLKFKEWFGLTVITLLGNFLIPFGGLGFRAVYLKKVHSFSYANFITTLTGVWVSNFLIFTLGGISALVYLFFKSQIIDLYLIIPLLIILFLSCLAFLPLKLPKAKNKIIKKITNLWQSWQKFYRQKEILKKLFVLTFWQLMISAGMLFFAYRIFDFQVPLIASLLPACLGIYSMFIRIVPASLGFFEAAVVYPSRILGLTIAQGLSVSGMVRLANILWTFALGIIFIYILIKPMKKKAK